MFAISPPWTLGGTLCHVGHEPTRAWRNWQTRRTQNPVLATECRFDPDRPHQRPLVRPGSGSTDTSNPNLLIRGGAAAGRIVARDERIVSVSTDAGVLVSAMKGAAWC
jgi:hypothetical protein